MAILDIKTAYSPTTNWLTPTNDGLRVLSIGPSCLFFRNKGKSVAKVGALETKVNQAELEAKNAKRPLTVAKEDKEQVVTDLETAKATNAQVKMQMR